MPNVAPHLATLKVKATAYVVRVTIASAFLLFPLVVMVAERIWGPSYGASPFKYFVYVLFYTIVPLAGAGAYGLLRQCYLRGGAVSLLEIALSAPGLVAAALYLSANGFWVEWRRIELIAVLASAATLAGAAASFLLPARWAAASERVCRPVAAAIAFVSPLIYAAVILWGQADWLLQQAAASWAFIWGLLTGAVCLAAIYAGPRLLVARGPCWRMAGKLLLAVLTGGAIGAILIIASQVGFSCGAALWLQTYGPWVGTAAAVLAGGIPMANVFSQYGLGYLAYAAAFKFIYPPSYYAADAVTVLFNAAALVLAIVICMKAARNRFLVLVVLVIVTLSLPWIWHSIPANAAPRFGPPLLLLLALAWLRPGRTVSWATVAAMVICTFWSFEIIVWSLVTYAGFLCAVCLERRGGLARALTGLTLVLSAITIAHFAFALWVHVESGSWPQYDIYAAFVHSNILNFWVAAPQFANPIWLLKVGACLTALAYALLLVLWRDQAHPQIRWVALSIILPGAVLCVMEQSYWVNRTFIGFVWQEILPVVISLTVLLDHMLMRGSRRIVHPEWVDAPVYAALMLLLLLLSALAATDVAQNLGRGKAYAHVMTGRPVASCIGARANDAMALVKKYNPGKRDALYFLPGSDDESIALYSGIRQRLGYTMIEVDFLSPPFIREIFRRLGDVRPGDVLVTMSHIQTPPVPIGDLLWAGAGLVEGLGTRFQACEIERTPLDVVAVRLMVKRENACQGVGKPFAYEVREKP